MFQIHFHRLPAGRLSGTDSLGCRPPGPKVQVLELPELRRKYDALDTAEGERRERRRLSDTGECPGAPTHTTSPSSQS